MIRRRVAALLLVCSLLLPVVAFGQQPARPAQAAAADPNDPIVRIREEGMKRSQVMPTLSYLTDVIGPRLTASPGMMRANEWTRDRLKAWGLENAQLEAWGPFGRGWTLKRFSAQVTEPQAIPLIAYPKAWSPGLKSAITASVVYLDVKDEAGLEKYRGQLRGAIVLMSGPREIKASFEPLGERLSEKELLRLADAPEPGSTPRRRFQLTPEQRAASQLAAKKLQFVTDEGAALLVDTSRGDGGTIFVQSASVPQPFLENPSEGKRISPWDKSAPKMPPQIVVSSEQYNRMVRMIGQGLALRMNVDLAVEYQDKDLMGYNTIAEIPGTDLKDEIVMIGAHMDSWHSGTGATDNAAGVAVAMEAVRILKALNLQPRRTIRIALWSGEEQGLLGSRAYVAQHFGQLGDGAQQGAASTGTNEGRTPSVTPKPDYDKFQAYFNLDNGTGKIRGVYLQGNEAVRPVFRRWLAPFRDMGAATLTIANTGGTDHQAFDAIGLPGFQFIQDEIEYETRTHHSNQDVYDRIQSEDMMQAATIMAAFIYNAATMNERLPRKPMTVAGR
ncbi:MAG TPA: M20/M25/M40 family metallo-hydrolase [Pyrinomonadaceae bacterium]